MLKLTKLIASSTLALGLIANVVNAKEVNFKGKTIEWIIPYKAGGGTDKWARFYAPMMSKALPGQPVVVIKNMPGGGSTKGANFFDKRASKKGLTILATSGSTTMPYLLDDKRVRYDYKDWNVVLGSPTGGVVYVSSNLGIKSAADLKDLNKPLRYGSQGATSLDLIPLLAFELLGLDVKPVFGMKGRKSGRLAFLRGETTIDYQTSSSYIKNVIPTVEKGNAVPLFSWGSIDKDGKLQRDPTFPDLPHFAEVYEMINGKKPSGAAFESWKSFFIAGFPAQKMIFLPKGTSNDIVTTYQKALEKVVNSSEFQEQKVKNIGVYEQLVGQQAETIKSMASSIDTENKTWVKNWLTTNYKVRF